MKKTLAILTLGAALAGAAGSAAAVDNDTLGTVVGGVAGGVVGHALLGGPVATIAGTLGGAYLGKKIATQHAYHGHHYRHHHHHKRYHHHVEQ